MSGWLDLTPLFKTTKTKRRDLRLYPKCNFLSLYYRMDEQCIGPNESLSLRLKWKELLLNWNTVDTLVRKLARIVRRQPDDPEKWNEGTKKQVHTIVFKLSMELKYIYSQYLTIINQTIPIWQNTIINVMRGFNLTKEEVYEILPQTQIMNLKLLFRQIFEPIIRLIDDIELKLLDGVIEIEKIEEFIDSMLLRILPHFERVYKEIVKRQEVRVW